MVRLLLALTAALAAGCSLYFGDDPPGPSVLDAPGWIPDAPGLPDAIPTACGSVDCGPGMHCEAQCAPPATDACSVPCHVTCVPDQACGACGPARSCVERCTHDCNAFPWVCGQSCDPHGNAGFCQGQVTCTQPMPVCPLGTQAGILAGCWSGYCIPTSQCGNTDPGSCSEGAVICESLPPMCPPRTVPGVRGGCWSGYCIPPRGCPCEALDTEANCGRRTDCAPVYQGAGCTCTGELCSCADPDATFARCRTR